MDAVVGGCWVLLFLVSPGGYFGKNFFLGLLFGVLFGDRVILFCCVLVSVR